MIRHTISWNREQLNPAKEGVNAGTFTRFTVPTDCNFFRLCFEGSLTGTDIPLLRIDGVNHGLRPTFFGGGSSIFVHGYCYEPPFKGPDIWYDQKILVEGVGGINLPTNPEITPNEVNYTSIYIERFYFDK